MHIYTSAWQNILLHFFQKSLVYLFFKYIVKIHKYQNIIWWKVRSKTFGKLVTVLFELLTTCFLEKRIPNFHAFFKSQRVYVRLCKNELHVQKHLLGLCICYCFYPNNRILYNLMFIKFRYSEKATKICPIFHL